jgi:hypothetical protein
MDAALGPQSPLSDCSPCPSLGREHPGGGPRLNQAGPPRGHTSQGLAAAPLRPPGPLGPRLTRASGAPGILRPLVARVIAPVEFQLIGQRTRQPV